MRILLLADIHIGSIKDTSYVYQIMTDIIDKELTATHSDMVIILGDYFDRLFKVNEECVSLAIDIMSYLVRACRREHTAIRLIYGTESHEMNQYILFNNHLTSSSIDIKVIDTAMEETFNGKHILYVPEEYVLDKAAHYSKFLNSNKQYDYIFGHGIIEDGMPGIVSISQEQNKNKEKQVPRFKSGELGKRCTLSVWGHYHCHTKMDNIYYLGSLFRNSFGEEAPKYYAVITDDQIEFIENTKAYIFKTYEFGPTHEVYMSSENILNEINKIKEENANLFDGNKEGRIRLLFRAPNNLDPNFREHLKELTINDSQIASLIKESSSEVLEEVQEDLEDVYTFVIDPSLNIIDKIYQFILTQHEVAPMSLKELHGYLDKIVDRIMISRKESTEERYNTA